MPSSPSTRRRLLLALVVGAPAAARASDRQPPAADTTKADSSKTDTSKVDSTTGRRRDRGPQGLEPLRVTAARTRARGYATAHTATATKTDAPLRDTPQSVSI